MLCCLKAYRRYWGKGNVSCVEDMYEACKLKLVLEMSVVLLNRGRVLRTKPPLTYRMDCVCARVCEFEWSMLRPDERF